eukprot:6173895-Pleurochrysis_carterae.AAC.2
MCCDSPGSLPSTRAGVQGHRKTFDLCGNDCCAIGAFCRRRSQRFVHVARASPCFGASLPDSDEHLFDAPTLSVALILAVAGLPSLFWCAAVIKLIAWQPCRISARVPAFHRRWALRDCRYQVRARWLRTIHHRHAVVLRSATKYAGEDAALGTATNTPHLAMHAGFHHRCSSSRHAPWQADITAATIDGLGAQRRIDTAQGPDADSAAFDAACPAPTSQGENFLDSSTDIEASIFGISSRVSAGTIFPTESDRKKTELTIRCAYSLFLRSGCDSRRKIALAYVNRGLCPFVARATLYSERLQQFAPRFENDRFRLLALFPLDTWTNEAASPTYSLRPMQTLSLRVCLTRFDVETHRESLSSATCQGTSTEAACVHRKYELSVFSGLQTSDSKLPTPLKP